MTDEAENVQMVPKHTPGPWWIEDRIEVWINAGRTHVATIPRAFDGDWSRANARLIAAAPDLLAELKRVTDHLSDWTSAHSMECTAEIDAALHCARAAIARATGGGA